MTVIRRGCWPSLDNAGSGASREPLPGFGDFLTAWRALIQESARETRRNNAAPRLKADLDTDEDRWLREVVRRLEGAAGLAKIARSTQRPGDLRAWCDTLIEAQQWTSARTACEEAARLAQKSEYVRGELLDGAALAAQALGRDDLPRHLERAWRAHPTLARLLRWLGAAGNTAAIRRRAARALANCPQKARAQQGVLHLVRGDLAAAAELLAAAPALGWSSEDHPGQVLFPVLCRLLGCPGRELESSHRTRIHAEDPWGAEDRWTAWDASGAKSMDDPDHATEKQEPRLPSPRLEEILAQAGVHGPADATTRSAVLKAMRTAAEKRIAGIVKNKHRRHYGHAASLAQAYVRCDPDPQSAAWMAAIRNTYRRYPAFRRALEDRADCGGG